MSPNDFATPTYTEPQAEALNQPAGGPEVDLNDPRFQSEDTGINPEGDAYATPPPPPDGEYRAKLKQIDVKDSKGNQARFAAWAKNDKVALFTAIEATIQDPAGKYDNLKVYDRWFSTMLNRDGSTKVSTLLVKLGVQVPRGASHKWLMDSLMTALAAEPDVIIETTWEASCQQCREEAIKKGEKPPRGVKGMKKFPLLPGSTTEHSPDVQCPVNPAHGPMSAQATISGFKSVK